MCDATVHVIQVIYHQCGRKLNLCKYMYLYDESAEDDKEGGQEAREPSEKNYHDKENVSNGSAVRKRERKRKALKEVQVRLSK